MNESNARNDEHEAERFWLLDKTRRMVVPVYDDESGVPLVVQWARRLTDDMRSIAYDVIDGHEVSTVFLGIDVHAVITWPEKRHTPILFESCVWCARVLVWQRRCCTLDEAEASHADALRRVRAHEFDQEHTS
jgi:hypothetical protein